MPFWPFFHNVRLRLVTVQDKLILWILNEKVRKNFHEYCSWSSRIKRLAYDVDDTKKNVDLIHVTSQVVYV